MTTTVAVLGGTGRLGSRLAPALDGLGLRRVHIDARDPDRVAERIAGLSPDVVVHLADPGPESSEEPRRATELARALAASSSRIVFASSAAVYGDAGARPYTERDPVVPHSAYARRKIEAERVLPADRTLALRIFNVYGPGMTSSLVTRLGQDGANVPLHGWDDYVRDYVHVDDVVQVLAWAVRADVVGVVNAATGVPTSTAELLDVAAVRARIVRTEPGRRSYSVGDPELARSLGAPRLRPLREALGG